MILNVYNNIRGYVLIEVRGFSVERFVNLAVHKGVYIWDIKFINNTVSMKVSIKGFKLLKNCAKKTKCKIKILDKKGYPFFLFKYRKRKILLWGLFLFIFGLYMLSSFVWDIEIIGNQRLKKEDILKYCYSNGLKIGAFKYGIDPKILESNIINNFSDISWISVYLKGTKVVLDISESLPKKEIFDNRTPYDIVATKNGLITNIVVVGGTPVVKLKDVVSVGDVLVKSELIIKDDENGILKEYKHSEADIKAKVYYEINLNIPFSYEEKVFTGNTKNKFSIKIFDYTLPLSINKIKFKNYEKFVSRKQIKLSQNYPLPIIIFEEKFKDFIYKDNYRNIEQAKEIAEKMLNSRIIREFDIQSDIIDKQYEFFQTKNSLKVKATITTIESIGKKIPIQNN